MNKIIVSMVLVFFVLFVSTCTNEEVQEEA